MRISLRLLILSGILSASAIGATSPFSPSTSGAQAEINAKDGDSAFNADYFSNSDLAGVSTVSRLEPAVGGDGKPVPGLPTRNWSARWSATLTPKVSGDYPVVLRSIGAAVVKVDGRVVLTQPETQRDFETRNRAMLALEASKPYEIVIELRTPDDRGRVALEWAQPEPPSSTAATTVRTELRVAPADGTAVRTVIVRENETCRLTSASTGDVTVREKSTGAEAVFRPEFAVVGYRQP